jgi:hypothetical protein
MKKFITGSIIGIIVILGSLFFVLKDHQQPIDSMFKAIPLDASAIIDIKDYAGLRNSLDTNNTLWKPLAKLDFIREIEGKFKFLDSLKHTNKELNGFLNVHSQWLISLHPTGKDDFTPIYYLKLENKSEFKNIRKVLDNWSGLVSNERKYEGETISDIILPANLGNFSCVYVRGLFVMSPSSILVENVVRQLNNNDWIIDKNGLGELMKSAGKNYPANIYFQMNAIPRFVSGIIHSKFGNVLRYIGNSGGWTELDLNIKKDIIVMNGFTAPGKDSLGFGSIFDKQEPQKLELFDKVPSDAIALIAFGISDIDKYWANHQKYLERLNQWKYTAARRDSISKKIKADLKADFKSVFDNECAGIVIPGALDSLESCSFSLIRIKSKDDAEKILTGWLEEYAGLADLKIESLISEINIDKGESFKVFHIPFGNIPAALLGNCFDMNSNEYCLVFENYLIFGSSIQGLKDYITFIETNNTLTKDNDFNALSDNLGSASNVFLYLKPAAPAEFYANFTKSSVAEYLNKNQNALSSLGAFVYQFSINNKLLIYNNILLNTRSSKEPVVSDKNWETRLESNLRSKPIILSNKTETNIFIQDEKNVAYFLNNKGRILWRLYLDEPVLSQVYQIDYFKNRKIQYMFNTRSKIYLVDRLGNPVDKFPVTLTDPATNGIAVVDYNNNRKYRIYYATESRKIVLMDKEGQLQNGWNFKKTSGRVSFPVQYFEYKNGDYLVFNDEKHIYILNRKGEDKIKVKTEFPVSVNNPVYFVPGIKKQKAAFVATDTAGLIHQINLKGEVSEIYLGKFPGNHFFDVADIDNDKNADYIFSWNQQIKAFQQDKTEIFTQKTGFPVVSRPDYYDFSNRRYLMGISSPENEKIYVYDASRNIAKGFPLKGFTQFSLILLNNSENRFNLIVGMKNNLLYNYSVQ